MHSPKQRRSLNAHGHKAALTAATKGGVILGRPRDHKLRNPETGRVFPCCYGHCVEDADARIDHKVPHDAPRWRNEETGEQEMLVYTFCSDAHRERFVTELAGS